ncbi:hypothetical protein E4U53_004968 [Claviceps sorghi]|nr:hypothetical protein E4U53_004968 [Claviceps sorghi]
MESNHAQRTQRFSIDSDPEAIHRAVVEDGVAVVQGFLPPEQVRKLNRDVDAPLLADRNRPRPQGTDTDKLWMADFIPEHVARVHNLVDFSHVFRHEVLNHPLLHAVCRRTFWDSGDYWLGYGAVIENGPGTEQQKWHRDQPV